MSVFYSKRIREKAGEVKHEAIVEAPIVEHVSEPVEEVAEVVEAVREEPVVARPRRNKR